MEHKIERRATVKSPEVGATSDKSVFSSITKARLHIETWGAWLHAMRRGIASVPENGREDGEEREVPPPRARRELLEREVPLNLDNPPKNKSVSQRQENKALDCDA